MLEQFVTQREAQWRELEGYVSRARRQVRQSSTSDIERFGILYRHTTSDLALAKRDYPGERVTQYLNNLCARTHPLLYRGQPLHILSLPNFYTTWLPRAWRSMRNYTAASAVIMFIGFAAGWLAVMLRPDLRTSLVPSSIFDEMARGHLGNSDFSAIAPYAAGFIISNNILVAIVCFAGGIAIGLPTALVLVRNGWMIGTIAAAVHIGGFDLAFWTLILPHGVIELSVIIFAGASGLTVGDSILRPGLRRRSDALVAAAQQAVGIALGVASLLVVCGLIEAFVSPSALPPSIKLSVGAITGILLYSWLLLAGHSREPEVKLCFAE